MFRPRTRTALVFWYASVDPFMVDRFNALARDGSVDFEVWFSAVLEPGRAWHVDPATFEFRHRFLPSIQVGTCRIGDPRRALAEAAPEVLVSFHGLPPTALSILQHLRRQSYLVYYVEKTFDSWVARSPVKEGAKFMLMRMADGFLSPGADADAYIRKYAGRNARIYRLSHALDIDHFAKAQRERRSPANLQLRKEMGLGGTVFLNVGRMIEAKGIGALLDAYGSLRRTRTDVSLLLVGNGKDREAFSRRALEQAMDGVVFLDFVPQANLPEVYALGDVFVFPTLGDPYGIVVDEAKAAGMPVIASTTAGEIGTRVRPHVEGCLVPPGNVMALKRSMSCLADDPRLVIQMGQQAMRTVEQQTVDLWVSQIKGMLEDMMRKEKGGL